MEEKDKLDQILFENVATNKLVGSQTSSMDRSPLRNAAGDGVFLTNVFVGRLLVVIELIDEKDYLTAKNILDKTAQSAEFKKMDEKFIKKVQELNQFLEQKMAPYGKSTEL